MSSSTSLKQLEEYEERLTAVFTELSSVTSVFRDVTVDLAGGLKCMIVITTSSGRTLSSSPYNWVGADPRVGDLVEMWHAPKGRRVLMRVNVDGKRFIREA